MKKIHRGLKNEEYQVIIKKGQRATNSAFALYWYPKSKEVARVGISVSKKLGGAVIRNSIKRQVREIARSIINWDKNYDYVVIVRDGYLTKDFKTNYDELGYLYNKIDKGGKKNANE